jgi:hypothetical protein
MSEELEGSGTAISAMPTRLLGPARWLGKAEGETCCVCERPMRIMVYDRPEGGVCVRCIEDYDAREKGRKERAMAKKSKTERVAKEPKAVGAVERAVVVVTGEDAVRLRALAAERKCSLAEVVRGLLKAG